MGVSVSSNFETYLVLLPDEHDGIDFGCLDPIQVMALDEKDAIRNAVEKWWGGSMYREGTAIVVPIEHATAYVLGELRGVEIVARTGLPNKLADKVT